MRNLKSIYILLAMTLVLTSCFDDPGTDIVFTGSLVEVDAATTPSNSRTFTFLRENIGASLPSGFQINLAAQPKSEAVTVNFEIMAASTAIDGVHYSTSGNSVTIAAGENLGELPITINPDNIEAGEVLSIVVRIASVSGGGTTISEVYREGTHFVQISCPRNIPTTGTWSGITTNAAFGATGTNSSITIEEDGPATGTGYTITDPTAGFYLNFGGTTDNPGTFDNICDNIVLGTTNIGEFSTTVSTSAANGFPQGTYDPLTETITIPWYDPGNDFGEITTLTRN